MSKLPKWKQNCEVKHVLRSCLFRLKKTNIINKEEWDILVKKIWEMYPNQKTIDIFPDYWN